jgi:hypothetical protein
VLVCSLVCLNLLYLALLRNPTVSDTGVHYYNEFGNFDAHRCPDFCGNLTRLNQSDLNGGWPEFKRESPILLEVFTFLPCRTNPAPACVELNTEGLNTKGDYLGTKFDHRVAVITMAFSQQRLYVGAVGGIVAVSMLLVYPKCIGLRHPYSIIYVLGWLVSTYYWLISSMSKSSWGTSYSESQTIFVVAAVLVLSVYYAVTEYLSEFSTRQEFLQKIELQAAGVQLLLTEKQQKRHPYQMFQERYLAWFGGSTPAIDSKCVPLITDSSVSSEDGREMMTSRLSQYSEETQAEYNELRAQVIAFDEFVVENGLAGAGGNAQVKKATWTKEVAFKLLNTTREGYGFDSLGPTGPQGKYGELSRELQHVARLKHPNIVNFLGIARNTYFNNGDASDERTDLFIVLEWCESTLSKYCDSQDPGYCPLSTPMILTIALETADAIKYMHSKDTLHLDIKPDNILINRNQVVKVADFGLTRYMDSPTHMVDFNGPTGTPAFLCPEILQLKTGEAKQVSEEDAMKIDSYAFGITLNYMLTKKPPIDAVEQVRAGKRPTLATESDCHGCPADIFLLVEECWAKEPRDRPGFATIYSRLAQACSCYCVTCNQEWPSAREARQCPLSPPHLVVAGRLSGTERKEEE